LYISEQLTGFKETERVTSLLTKYGLPTMLHLQSKAFEILKKDKISKGYYEYVLLDKIGKGVIKSIP